MTVQSTSRASCAAVLLLAVLLVCSARALYAGSVSYQIAGTALHHDKVSLSSMAVKGDYGYVGTSDGLQVVDVSASPRMKLITTLQLGPEQGIVITSMTIVGDYLYATVWDGGQIPEVTDSFHALVIVDIANPSAPQVVSRSQTSSKLLSDVKVFGDFAYVISVSNIRFSGDDLEVFDISDKHAPVPKGRWIADPLDYLTPSGVAVSGDLAYIAAQSAMVIIDVSNPDSLSFVGRIEPQQLRSFTDVVVEDSIAYLAEADAIQNFSRTNSSEASSSFSIVNVSDPIAPQLIFSGPFPFINSFGIDKVDNYVYLANADCGMAILDVSDVTAPFVSGSFLTAGYCVDVAGDRDGADVFAFDVLLPLTRRRDDICANATTTVGFPTPPETFQDIDVSDKTRPFLKSYYDPNNFVSQVALVGNYAYVLSSVQPESLRVLDISAEDTITHVNSVPLPGSGTSSFRNGNYLYVTAGQAGLLTFDVSDPVRPNLMDRDTTSGFANGLKGSGSFLYVANGLNGLVVFDIGTPQNPAFIAQRDTPDDMTGALDLAVSDSYIYVADGSDLATFDISQPQAPVLTGVFTDGDARGIADVVTVNGLAVINSENDIYFLSLSNPATPELKFSLHIEPDLRHDNARDIETANGLLFLGLSKQGVRIFEFTADTLLHSVEQILGGGFVMGLALGKSHANSDIIAVADRWGFVLLRQDIITDVIADNDPSLKPEAFQLQQNYPNPFNPATTISYSLPHRTHVRLEIYNILGRRIKTLVDRFESVGEHSVIWDGNGPDNNPVASGLYLYRLTTGEMSASKTMILLK